MLRRIKRGLCLLLVCAMLLALVSGTAFAVEAEESVAYSMEPMIAPSETGDYRLRGESRFSADLSMTWGTEQVKGVSQERVRLTFWANNGTGDYEVVGAYIGETYGDAMARALPPLSIAVNHGFSGTWSFEPVGHPFFQPQVDPFLPITDESPRELFALWIRQPPPPHDSITHSFVGNGGTPRQQWTQPWWSEIETFGDAFQRIEQPIKEGYLFAGWFSAPEGGVQIRATDAIEIHLEWYRFRHLYAQWEQETLPPPLFADVSPTAWYYPYVRTVSENNIMSGVGNNQFNPQVNVTRSAVAALLFRVHNGRTANEQDDRNNNFNDVGNTWYAPYVTWAFDNNIVSGTSPTTFNPHGNITRQEFATMVYRYAMNMTVLHDGEVSTVQQWEQWLQFADREQIATWAQDALRWMNFRGIVTGSTTTTINPLGTATRAEAATVMMRFVEQIPPPHFPATRSNSMRTGMPVPLAVGVNREVHSLTDHSFFITVANSISQLRAIYANDFISDGINYIYGYTDVFFNDKAIVVMALMENSGGFSHDIELVRSGNVLGVNIRRFVPGAGYSEGEWWCVSSGEPISLPGNISERRILLEVNREDITGITSIEYFRH